MIEFLETIWTPQGEGYAEVRLINNEGYVSQSFWEVPRNLSLVIEDLTEILPGFNAFAGVLLRTERSGKAEATKKVTPVLWADFDTKNFSSRMATFYAVQRVDIPPQIVIDSGHGFHAYWLLDQAIAVDTAQRIMNGMSNKYGSDKVGDPARVMRVPGTYNVKDPNAKQLVRMIRFEPLERVRSGDFYDYIEDTPRYTDYFGDIKKYSGNPAMDERLNSTPPRGERSEYIFGIVCDMVRAGWSLGGAYDTLIDSVAGQKLRDMDDQAALRWMQRTYEAAVKAVRMDG